MRPTALRDTNRDRSPEADRGAVAIMVAVFAVVALILLAFVVDRGQAYFTRGQLQNAVDAAALAGAQELCVDTLEGGAAAAAAMAVDFARQNGVTVDPLNAEQLTIATNGSPPFVSVAGAQTLTSVFGQFAGVQEVTVAARATAGLPCVKGYSLFAANEFRINGGGSGITVDGAPAYGGSLNFQGNGNNKTFLDGLQSPNGEGARWNDGTNSITDAQYADPQGTATEYADSIGLTAYITGLGAPGAGNWHLGTPPVDCDVDLDGADGGNQVVYCSGTATVRGSSATTVMVRADAIDIAGDINWNGSSCTGNVLLYATSGGVTNQGSAATMCGSIYSPAGLFLSGGNLLQVHQGRIVADTIRVNGAGGGGLLVDLNVDPILGPGDVKLIQ